MALKRWKLSFAFVGESVTLPVSQQRSSSTSEDMLFFGARFYFLIHVQEDVHPNDREALLRIAVDTDYYLGGRNIAENVLPRLTAMRTVMFARLDKSPDRQIEAIAKQEKKGTTLRECEPGYVGEYLVNFRDCAQDWACPCPELLDMYYYASYSNPLEPPEYETWYDHLHAGYGDWDDDE